MFSPHTSWDGERLGLAFGFPVLSQWLVMQNWSSWSLLSKDFGFVALVVKILPGDAGNMGDVGSIHGSGRSLGERNVNPLQYYCLQNPMGRGAWQVTVHRVTKSQTQMKRLHTHTHTHKRERFGNTGKRFLSYSVFSQKCGGPGDQFTAGCSTKV